MNRMRWIGLTLIFFILTATLVFLAMVFGMQETATAIETAKVLYISAGIFFALALYSLGGIFFFRC
jgi:hypothetical protein